MTKKPWQVVTAFFKCLKFHWIARGWQNHSFIWFTNQHRFECAINENICQKEIISWSKKQIDCICCISITPSIISTQKEVCVSQDLLLGENEGWICWMDVVGWICWWKWGMDLLVVHCIPSLTVDHPSYLAAPYGQLAHCAAQGLHFKEDAAQFS